jgi:DNA-binding NarL/FixJ family response regulator
MPTAITHAIHCGRYDCGHIVRSDSAALKRALYLHLCATDGQGYLGARNEPADVLAALALMAQGAPCTEVAGVTPRTSNPPAAAVAPTFTPRGLEVLSLVAEGKDIPEMADATGLSVETVRSHLAVARKACGAHSSAEAAMIASRFGLI